MQIGELVAFLRVDADAFTRGIAKAKAKIGDLTRDLDRSSRNVATFGKALAAVGGVPAFAIVAGSAIAASGAVLGLVSAAGVAGGVFATLKAGTAGVGDALKALAAGDATAAAAALAKLSPAAREATLAMHGVRESFRKVQQVVQGNLFAGLGPQIAALGTTYLPILEAGLGRVAAGLNRVAKQAMTAASSPFMRGVVADVLARTGGIMDRLAPTMGHLVTMLGALVRGAMPLVEAFVAWLAPLAESGAAFLSSAEGAAWMTEKVTAAKEGISTFSAIIGQLWPILTAVGGALQTFAGWFSSLPGPVQSVVGQFLGWSLVIGVVAAKLSPLIVVIGRLAPMLMKAGGAIVMAVARWGLLGGAAKTAAVASNASALSVVRAWVMMAARATVSAVRTAAAWVLTAGASAASAVASTVAAGARIVAQWVVMAAGAMARAVVMAAAWLVAMGPIGWVIAAVVALVALIIANWDTVKAWTIAAWDAVVGAVVAAWEWIKGAVSAAAQFIVDLFMNWSLPGLLITHWDSIMGAVSAAWEWIKSTVSSAGQAVVDFLTNAWDTAVNLARSAWDSIVSTVQNAASNLLSFVSGLPGRILSALSGLGSLLVSAGGSLVDGLWRGISNGWNWLVDKVWNLARSLLDAAMSALGIGSPSKEFRTQVGRWIPEGLADGILANARTAADAARTMSADTVAAAIGPARQVAARTPGGMGLPTATPGGGDGRSVTVNVEINNPRAERGSDSVARELADLSLMGAFDL